MQSYTLKLSIVVPTNSMALYVAPDIDISPMICTVLMIYQTHKRMAWYLIVEKFWKNSSLTCKIKSLASK